MNQKRVILVGLWYDMNSGTNPLRVIGKTDQFFPTGEKLA